MRRVEPGERAALYYRVSTEEQERVGLSLDAQREALLQFAKDNQLRVVGEFRDGGFSARKKWRTRPAFVDLMKAVESNAIDVILFVKLDRWFRNISDYYEVQRILDAHNVRWIATMEDYDTTTANGRLTLNIKLSIAQDEADRTSERIKFVFAAKKARGELVSYEVPFGYRVENKRMALDPETAPIARQIFDYYLACGSRKRTQRYMLELGVRRSLEGVFKMLVNPKYYGCMDGVEGSCPAIITKEEYQAIQTMIHSRAPYQTKTERVFLFTGIIFCECGAKMTSVSAKGHMYYRCNKYYVYRECEHSHYLSEAKLENFLLEQISRFAESYNMSIKQTAKRQKSTANIQQKLDRLKQLYINGFIEFDEFTSETNKLKAELQEDPKKEIDTEKLASLVGQYSELSRQGKRAFWHSIIERIEVSVNEEFSVTIRS